MKQNNTTPQDQDLDLAILQEVMDAYDKARAKWEAHYGAQFNEQEFHAWFTSQVQK